MDCFVLFAARGAVRHWRALNPMEVLEERRVPGAQLYEHPKLPSRQARGSFEERPPGQGGVYGTQRPSAPVGARVEALRGSTFCGERVDCMIIDHGTK